MDVFAFVLVRILFAWLALQKVVASVHFCDFETGDTLCGYVQDGQDDFDWRVRQGATPTSETGPSFDHTLGANSTGHYMYIEASGPGIWDTARLLSPTFGPTPAFCLRFFYHMSGVDTGRLSVRLRSRGGEVETVDALWTLKGEQGEDWTEAAVDGSSSSSDFEVAFEAKRGEGFKSDIAIDDITLTSGTTCGGTIFTRPPTSKPVTPDDDSTSSDPINGQKTDPSSTVTKKPVNVVSRQPVNEVTSTLLDPIDSHLVIVVLAVGLSFWGVVFASLAIVVYKRSQSKKCKKDNVTYDVIDEPANQEVITMTSEGKQSGEQSYA